MYLVHDLVGVMMSSWYVMVRMRTCWLPEMTAMAHVPSDSDPERPISDRERPPPLYKKPAHRSLQGACQDTCTLLLAFPRKYKLSSESVNDGNDYAPPAP